MKMHVEYIENPTPSTSDFSNERELEVFLETANYEHFRIVGGKAFDTLLAVPATDDSGDTVLVREKDGYVLAQVHEWDDIADAITDEISISLLSRSAFVKIEVTRISFTF